MGLGQGTPEKIPAYYNDFIFAVVCEQLGQAFGVLLLAVYVLLILRGVTVVARAALRSEICAGLRRAERCWGIQTFMIVAGVIKMIRRRVTMPFLSYGGSSLALVHGDDRDSARGEREGAGKSGRGYSVREG